MRELPDSVVDALADACALRGELALEAAVAWEGWSDNLVLRLVFPSGAAYLKTGHGLGEERERLLWLAKRLPAPRVLGSGFRPELEWLLTAELAGSDLARHPHTSRPEWLVAALAEALKRLHALDVRDCPFSEPAPDHVVCHGDACLPNFVFSGSELSGYLDLGLLGLAPVESDLAAAVWSLDYNLGPGWGAPFLAAYGWPAGEDEVERLRERYAEGVSEPTGPTWPVKEDVRADAG